MKLLSIVIPTRGREYYCIEAIKDILSYERDDFELVICDNSDTDQIEEYLNEHPDGRVVYQHIRGRINSVINMDTAMRMATGEYVCMIGDDDTILPSIFEVTEWAKNNDYDNVTPVDTVKYYWPGSVSKEGWGQWQINVCNGNKEELICEKQLERFAKNGLLHYSGYLPRVYHGLIRRAVLVEVKNKTDHIIGGLSPDIYMSISCACVMKSFIRLSLPFTVSGACAKSSTSESMSGGHRGGMDSIPHMYKRGYYIWDKRVPQVYAVETIWGESAIKALEEMGHNDLINKIKQGYLIAELYRKNRNLGEVLKEAIKNVSLKDSKAKTCFDFASYFIVKSWCKLFRRNQQWKKCENLNHISEVVVQYNNWKSIKKQKTSW